MSEYYIIADIDSKKVYNLGSKTSAKYSLPYIAKLTEGNMVCFFGDETHGFLEDKYESGTYEEDYGQKWGPKYLSCDVIIDESYREWLDNINISYDTFFSILEHLGGIETNELSQNLQTYINLKSNKKSKEELNNLT